MRLIHRNMESGAWVKTSQFFRSAVLSFVAGGQVWQEEDSDMPVNSSCAVWLPIGAVRKLARGTDALFTHALVSLLTANHGSVGPFMCCEIDCFLWKLAIFLYIGRLPFMMRSWGWGLQGPGQA